MKNITYFLLLSLFVVGCKSNDPDLIPEDLVEVKKMLSAKKKELSALKEKISTLENKVDELEPKTEVSKKSVKAFVIEPTVFKSYTELPGNVVSAKQVRLAAEMGGRILTLTVDAGDYVRKGQVVGTVDVEYLRKQKEELLTGLSLAKDVFERQQRLWNQKIGSEVQYLQSKNSKERLEKSLSTLESQLQKEQIKAPISGYISMMFLKEGEMTGAGTPIAMVEQTSEVIVEVDLLEDMLLNVKRGKSVEVTIPTIDQVRRGNITRLETMINPANRTLKAEIRLNNSGQIIKPNMRAVAKINDVTVKDALVLPTKLVQQDVSGNSYVMTVAEGEDGLYAQKNIVQTGMTYDSKVEIKEGLSAGDRIIELGARGLANGELIDIK